MKTSQSNNKTNIEKIAQQILLHKRLYYAGHPEISDAEYDTLEDTLATLSPDHPVLSLVGSDELNTEKIPHEKKMLSLSKTYDMDDLKTWVGFENIVGMFKIDGVSCSIIYENSKLKQGKTRGNGEFGEDITKKVLWCPEIHHTISKNEKVEIRGELYCSQENFEKLATEMEKRKLSRPTSARNIVAGLLGRKDNIDLMNYISFFAFDIISDSLQFKFETERFKFLETMQFKTPNWFFADKFELIENFLQKTEEFMANGNYQIDGAVFAYDNIMKQNELGYTAHHPRFKMAFKFQGLGQITRIDHIEWSVSRNGVLTPIGVVEPIELSSALISRVSLHNYALVKKYQLRPGDSIEMIRSGEVIPKFLKVVKHSDQAFSLPEKCPECHFKVTFDDVRLYCSNDECPARKREEIIDFVQKLGIEDLSEKRLQEMIEIGLIHKASDLFKLQVEDFLTMDKVKDKMANKLFKNIQKMKKVPLLTFVSALGISGGGKSKCLKIIENGYTTLDKFLKVQPSQLEEIESFAKISAQSFVDSLQSKKAFIQDLLDVGIKVTKACNVATQTNDLSFVITGSLNRPRTEIETFIQHKGSKVSSSVSKNTSYLVMNTKDSTSSKYKKATKLGISIISEDELYNLLESQD